MFCRLISVVVLCCGVQWSFVVQSTTVAQKRRKYYYGANMICVSFLRGWSDACIALAVAASFNHHHRLFFFKSMILLLPGVC
jgi:hypothetical protein